MNSSKRQTSGAKTTSPSGTYAYVSARRFGLSACLERPQSCEQQNAESDSNSRARQQGVNWGRWRVWLHSPGLAVCENTTLQRYPGQGQGNHKRGICDSRTTTHGERLVALLCAAVSWKSTITKKHSQPTLAPCCCLLSEHKNKPPPSPNLYVRDGRFDAPHLTPTPGAGRTYFVPTRSFHPATTASR